MDNSRVKSSGMGWVVSLPDLDLDGKRERKFRPASPSQITYLKPQWN